jgi:hypothetical protein
MAPVLAVSDATCVADAVPGADGSGCFDLGAAVLDRSGVDKAEAREIEGSRPCVEDVVTTSSSLPVVFCVTATDSTAPGPTTPSSWVVELTLTEDGIRSFNTLATECFNFGVTCPLGQIAVVVDGEVMAAPSIEQPSFERDQISLSWDLDPAAADDLASRLSS